MTNLFTRSEYNPILRPNSKNWWEAKKLYNPGAIFDDGKYHLFYRAVGSGIGWKSVVGYALSDDGENFSRFDEPLLIGGDEYEKRGLEDPRITGIEDTFYMAYAAYDGITPRLCIATSHDLKKWKKHGPAFSGWMFDEAGGVRTRFDENGIKWTGDQTPFLAPREGNFFDNIFVEMGPSPIKTEKGWLVLYHGVNDKYCYKIGFLIQDLENPREIIFRSDLPIFEPIKDYELSGIVDVLPGGLESLQRMSDEELKRFLAKNIEKGTMPKVTFCCGATVVNEELRIFYGASDSVICTATARLNDILSLVK